MEKIKITDEQYERIKVIQLDMLKELHQICEKHDINYCLGFGTMLGAIRHKGFIPWDDDADVLMLREDYDRFREVCAKELPEKYFLQDADTDSEYLWGYAKLRNVNTEYIRCGQEHIKCKTGVFIDIFPLDDVPDALPLQIYQDYIYMLRRKALWAQVGKYTEQNMLKRVAFGLMSRISKESIYRHLKKEVYKQKKGKSKRVRCLLFAAPGKHWNKKGNKLNTRYGFEREWITNRTQVEFEGHMFWGTKDYDRCLTYLYGDYMKLPPEEKRVGHAPVSKIDLGNEGAGDNLYWNEFYRKGVAESKPTLFAQFVMRYLEQGKTIVDVGCGNGRDSIYFGEQGMNVYAVDMSETATQYIQSLGKQNINVRNQNFISMLGNAQEEYDYLYSRFTVHAISEEDQKSLLHNAYQSLKKSGYFFIEVRCKLDTLYGKGELVEKDTYFYNGHRRRFVDQQELEHALRSEGFVIQYSEQKEGFAPYKGENPIVLRIIARKEI